MQKCSAESQNSAGSFSTKILVTNALVGRIHVSVYAYTAYQRVHEFIFVNNRMLGMIVYCI